MSVSTGAPSSVNKLRGAGESPVFERALDCLPDGVLIMRDDRTLAYANAACAKMWGVPETLLQAGDQNALMASVMHLVADPVQFLRESERLRNSLETSEDELLFKDGRIVSRRSVPFELDGRPQGRIWMFRDVTEERRASLDGLTGLPNRHAYTRDYSRSVLADDDGRFRAVCIMDVDNFKRYNDIYGHAAGDAILRRVGGLLRTAVSDADDLVFRIGGEEFLVIHRSERPVAIMAFFEKLRAGVAGTMVEHAGNLPHGVATASFGVTVFRGAGDPEAMFRRADAALYRAKSTGRNRVALAAGDGDARPHMAGI